MNKQQAKQGLLSINMLTLVIILKK